MSNLNLSKATSQQQQIPKIDNINPSANALNMSNLNSNMPYNSMIPNVGMQQPDASSGFTYPGLNPAAQQGFYPMFWYYPPSQGGNLDQNYASANTASNAQMPYVPYPMGYYVNPQMVENKDTEASNTMGAKARKTNYYSNASNYQGNVNKIN